MSFKAESEHAEDREEEEVSPFVDKREPEPSPWGDKILEDSATRVVGWRNGEKLVRSQVGEFLRADKGARKHYRSMMQANANARDKAKAKLHADPLAGLPPTWQAFWSTVPHLDSQTAYRRYEKERRALLRAAEAKEMHVQAHSVQEGEKEKDEDIEAQNIKLEEEERKKRFALAEKERTLAEWNRKLAGLRKLDDAEEESSKKKAKNLQYASYEHGVVEGKLRSSDVFFHFLHGDHQKQQGEKIIILNKSCTLMVKQMEDLKKEFRDMLKAQTRTSAGQQSAGGFPPSAPSGTSHSRTGSARSVHSEAEDAGPSLGDTGHSPSLHSDPIPSPSEQSRTEAKRQAEQQDAKDA